MSDDEDEDEDAEGVALAPGGRRVPTRVAKSERILNLIAVLLRAEGPVPVTDILGKVTGYDDAATRDSLMRRFERDKKVLRDIGIPIEHAPATSFAAEGYQISRRDYFLADELVLPPESSELLRCLYAWAHADGAELSADLRSALVKLGFLVHADLEADEEPRERVEPLPPEATEPLEPQPGRAEAMARAARNLEVLSEAVLRRRRVRFRYYTFGRDEENELEVDPYGLGFSGQAWHKGAWYLVGYSHLRGAIRVFKVQRIRSTVRFVRSGEAADGAADFTAPPGFRVRRYLGKTRWEFAELSSAFGGGAADAPAPEPFEARVGFDHAVAAEVRSLVPSARPVPVGEVSGARAAHTYLQFEVHQRRPFLRFLLRFLPRVHVVAPEGLEGALRALAREVLARYQPGPGGGREA